jgi:hypothetical protein
VFQFTGSWTTAHSVASCAGIFNMPLLLGVHLRQSTHRRNWLHKVGLIKLEIMLCSKMPFSYSGSHTQSRVKQFLWNCCNLKLSQTVSHNFNFVGNAVIFNPDYGDSMFIRKVAICLLVLTPSQPRRAMSSYSAL